MKNNVIEKTTTAICQVFERDREVDTPEPEGRTLSTETTESLMTDLRKLGFVKMYAGETMPSFRNVVLEIRFSETHSTEPGERHFASFGKSGSDFSLINEKHQNLFQSPNATLRIGFMSPRILTRLS